MARLARSAARTNARIAATLESDFAKIAENQPEVLARHCTEANLIEKAAGLGPRRDSGHWRAPTWLRRSSNLRGRLPKSRRYRPYPHCDAKKSSFKSH